MKRPYITYVLLALAGLVAWLTHFGSPSKLALVEPLFISAYLQGFLLEVHAGQWWRLITPIFLHFGAMHFIFNSLMTWQLGELLEPKLSHARFAALILLIAISSNLAQYWVSGPAFGGLSGVLYGLFGYLWLSGHYLGSIQHRLQPQFIIMLMAWLVLGWFNFFGLLGEIRIANTAHAIGLISGAGLALFIRPPRH